MPDGRANPRQDQHAPVSSRRASRASRVGIAATATRAQPAARSGAATWSDRQRCRRSRGPPSERYSRARAARNAARCRRRRLPAEPVHPAHAVGDDDPHRHDARERRAEIARAVLAGDMDEKRPGRPGARADERRQRGDIAFGDQHLPDIPPRARLAPRAFADREHRQAPVRADLAEPPRAGRAGHRRRRSRPRARRIDRHVLRRAQGAPAPRDRARAKSRRWRSPPARGG